MRKNVILFSLTMFPVPYVALKESFHLPFLFPQVYNFQVVSNVLIALALKMQLGGPDPDSVIYLSSSVIPDIW